MKSEKVTKENIVILIILLAACLLFVGYLIWFKSLNNLIALSDDESKSYENYSSFHDTGFDNSLFKMEQYNNLKVFGKPLEKDLRPKPNNPFELYDERKLSNTSFLKAGQVLLMIMKRMR